MDQKPTIYLGSHSLILSKKWNRHHKYHSRSLNGRARALQIFRPLELGKYCQVKFVWLCLAVRMLQVVGGSVAWIVARGSLGEDGVWQLHRRPADVICYDVCSWGRAQVFPKSCLWVLTCHSLNQQPEKKSFNKKWDKRDHIGSSFFLDFCLSVFEDFHEFVKGFLRVPGSQTNWLTD